MGKEEKEREVKEMDGRGREEEKGLGRERKGEGNVGGGKNKITRRAPPFFTPS